MHDLTWPPPGTRSAPARWILAARQFSQVWDGRCEEHPEAEAGGGQGAVRSRGYRGAGILETVWDQFSRTLFSAIGRGGTLCPFLPHTADNVVEAIAAGLPGAAAAAGDLRGQCWIQLVPPEILSEIFTHLDVRSLLSFSATCRYVYTTLHSTVQNWHRCDFTALAGLVDASLEAFLSLADSRRTARGAQDERRPEDAGREGDRERGARPAESADGAFDGEEGEDPAGRRRARDTAQDSLLARTSRSPPLPVPVPLQQFVFAAAIRSVVVDSTLVTHHILALVLPRLPSLEHLSARRCPRIDIMRLAVAALVLVLDQERWWFPPREDRPDDGQAEVISSGAAAGRRQARVKFKQLKLKSLWIRGAGASDETPGYGDDVVKWNPVEEEEEEEEEEEGDAGADDDGDGGGGGGGQEDGISREAGTRWKLRDMITNARASRFRASHGVGEPGTLPRPGEVSALRALARALSALTSHERPVDLDLSACSTCQEAVSVVNDDQPCIRCALPIVKHALGRVCERCCRAQRKCGACWSVVLCEECSRRGREGTRRPLRQGRAAGRAAAAKPDPIVCFGCKGRT